MNSPPRSEKLSILGIVSGCVLIWLSFQPENMLCPHERIIQACNPNFFYLIPGILVVLIGISLLVVQHRRNPPIDPPETGA
jgi:hypothetical protein